MKKFLSIIKEFWQELKDDIRRSTVCELFDLWKALVGLSLIAVAILALWVTLLVMFPLFVGGLTLFILLPGIAILAVRFSDDERKNNND